MNLKEIRQEAWDQARDLETSDEGRLWKTKEMNRYINRVYRRIARETRVIRDAVTPEICLIPSAPVDWTTLPAGSLASIWANDPDNWLYQKTVSPYLFPLDPRIIAVDEVKWVKRAWKLVRVSAVKWQRNPFWERVCGMPTEYALDLSANTLALNFRDTVEDTLQLVVRRLPLKDLSQDSDVPEFKVQYHDFMVNGILSLMYMKQDAETIDKQKAVDYEGLFLRDLDRLKREEGHLDERLHANAALGAFR